MRLWFVRDVHSAVREEFSEYLDGRLSPQRRGHLETHLARCQACREYLEAVRATVEIVRSLPQAPVPRSFRISAAQVAQPAQESYWYGLLPGLRLASAAVGVLLLAVVAIDVSGTTQMAFPQAGSGVVAEVQKAAPAAEAPVRSLQAPEVPSTAELSQGATGAVEARPESGKATDQAAPPPAPQATLEPEGAGSVFRSVPPTDNAPLRVLEAALLVMAAVLLGVTVALGHLGKRRFF